MTIDELINGLYRVSDILENHFGGNPYTNEEQEALDLVDYAINFIEWYKGQDLVRREDIPKYELWCCARRSEVQFNALIEEIPKAEPFKE